MSIKYSGDQRLLDSESEYPWYSGTVDHEVPERSDSGPGSGDDRSNLAATDSRRWPWFVWFLLKLLGLYNHRPAVARRRCLQCWLTAAEMRCVVRGEGVPGYLYPGARLVEDEGAPEGSESGSINAQLVVLAGRADNGGEEMGFLRQDETCLVCQSEWWDAYGRYQPYTEDEIGVTRWNHRGSAVISVIWQTLVIGTNVACFLPFFFYYWGIDERRIDLVIYSGFMLYVLHIPILCLAANLSNVIPGWQRHSRNYAWSNALGIGYVIKRLQHLDLRGKGLPYKVFLLVCFAWPLFNSVWRVVIYLFFLPSENRTLINISLVSASVGMGIWGTFCYLVALMRLSFQRQFEMELAFLRKHRGNLDRCRRRLTLLMEEFGSLGSLATIWIMFSIAVATWSIATQVYFDYAEDSHNQTVGHNKTMQFKTSKELDRCIWSEISMFLLLPLVAVGGLDLNSLWVRFQRHIGEMRLGRLGGSRDAFCDQILAYCNEHPPVRNIETITLLVSALGLCLAIEFKERDDFDIVHHHS